MFILCRDRNTIVRNAIPIRNPIALIIDKQIGGMKSHPAQRRERGLLLHFIFSGHIADDESQITPNGALQGRPKRLDQMMRKILQKADRIDEQKRDSFDLECPGCRIKRRKERILYHCICSRQRIQEGRFPCIRVPDKGDRKHLVFFSAFRQHRSSLLQILQFSLQSIDTRADMPAICLQLSFPGTSGADAAP